MDPEPSRPTLKGIARWLGAGIVAGLIGGFVFGGIGGRLAMFLLRVTSGPEVIGLKSDDGFVIGRFSADTGFLVLFSTSVGALGGVVYVAIRSWLPGKYRSALAGFLAAGAIGSPVIHPEGVDFKELSPLWLAIALFLILPAAYGVVTSRLAEKLAARTSNRFIPWLALLGVPGLPALIGVQGSLIGPVIAVILVVLVLASTRVEAIPRVLSSLPVILFGRALLLLAAGWFTVSIIRDAIIIL